ncbi:MAG: PIG-L family deacetylase [Armatimonadota bacterium]
MKCLVVVAHPDDEIIWMGGVFLRHPQWDWHIVSLCRADDDDRAPRFQLSAKTIGATALISDLDDSSPILAPLSPDLNEIKRRISLLALHKPDLIFTHGKTGEYTRHMRHEQVHRAVCDMVDSGDIAGELIFFAYDDCGGERRPQPLANADITLTLFDEEYTKKRKIIRDIYGFRPGSFEYDASGPVEGFHIRSSGISIDQFKTIIQNSDN